MKTIVLAGLFFVAAISAPVQTGAQTFTGQSRDDYLSVDPEEDDSPFPVDLEARSKAGARTWDITAIMGARYELPDSLYDLTILDQEADEDTPITVVLKLDGFGRSTIWYPLEDGGWEIDTAFNAEGLLAKVVRATDDSSRKYMLIREFPVWRDDDMRRYMPQVGDDPYVDMLYVGDPHIFSKKPPTPKRELQANAVELVILIPESEAERIWAEYTEADREASERSQGRRTGQKKQKDPIDAYTKKVLEDLIVRNRA